MANRMKVPGQRELRYTAYHEAGHAVAAWQEGIRFRSVSIVPKGDALGYVLHNRPPRWFQPDIASDRRTRDRCEAMARTLLAGPEAEARIRGRRNHVGASDDYAQAVDYVTRISGGPEMTQAWMSLIKVQVTAMLGPQNWRAVEAMAEALLLHHRISGNDARTIMNDAIPYVVAS